MEALVAYFHEMPDEKDGLTVQLDLLDNTMKAILSKRLGPKFASAQKFEGCTAATSTAIVDSWGRLWPCQALAYPTNPALRTHFDFGDNSLLNCSLEQIWRSPGFNKLRELNSQHLHTQLARPCTTCRFRNLCSPCPLPHVMGLSMDKPRCTRRAELFARSASN